MSRMNRRSFLTRGAAVVGAGAGALAAVEVNGGRTAGAEATTTTDMPTAEQQWLWSQAELAESVPFTGMHQAGIVTPRQQQASFVALDSVAPDHSTLVQALQALSERAQQLAVGGPIPRLEVDAPPADSGILGPYNSPDSLTVTIGLGASLFDDRYGLAPHKPLELTQMPTFSIDELDPARSHGDLLLQIGANSRDTVVHTVRELLRTVRGSLELRWMQDGFSTANRGPSPHSNGRNLFAFRDGTANPLTRDPAQMAQLVWAAPGEPSWAHGGTYQVIRLIRQHVEFWDRVGLTEQQNMIGRVRDTGAPLGGTNEFQDPRYDLDPQGKRIPLDAHIRLANPRTPATNGQRILRRGFNYSNGFDTAGQLDQGLVFVAFNQSPQRQFAAVQTRLLAEPMVDYISPVGGGYFFVPPGAQSGGDWVGSGLFSAACASGTYLKCLQKS